MVIVRRKENGHTGFEQLLQMSGKTAFSKIGDVESDVNGAELRRIADELRLRLSVEDCRQLAELLVSFPWVE